jgi:probable HAF family extracellular repeat protein
MQTKSSVHFRRLGLAVLAALLMPVTLTGQALQIIDLDPGHATVSASAFRMAETGQAVGTGMLPTHFYSQALWFTAEGPQRLELLRDDEQGTAFDVSETGRLVGESVDLVIVPPGVFDADGHAVVWEDGVVTELATLVAERSFVPLRQAIRINERGQILVRAREADELPLHALLFEGGALTDLGRFEATDNVEARDLNEQGHAVGTIYPASGYHHAFLWADGVMVDLHDPATIPGPASTATAINESEAIVGGASFTEGVYDQSAALWVGGSATNLGMLPGSSQSMANDVNEHGTVVGYSMTPVGFRAFVWREGQGMQDLNGLIPPGTGWTLLNAHDVSNDGRIVGEGEFADEVRPFLLVPDCAGGFTIYGAGSPGSDGFLPALWGEGCGEAGGELSLAITNGVGGAGGLLLLGAGMGVVPFKGGELQILPLLDLSVPVVLAGSGAGAGAWQLGATLPPSLPAAQITLQAILQDPAVPSGFTVTNPLQFLIP